MSLRPGHRNALTDVEGISVGNAHDPRVRTGTTVVRFDRAFRCAVDVRGGGPATRETNAVGADATLGIAHAITLSGGSVFGLAAADVVASSLSIQGVGFAPVEGVPRVPIVPAACLYDLGNGGKKEWGLDHPYSSLAEEALLACSGNFDCGTLGAGYGAIAGTWQGGLGTASVDLGEDGVVSALIAVNSIGSAVMPGGRCFWSWPFEHDAEFGGLKPNLSSQALDPLPSDLKRGAAGEATCIGVVAASTPLNRSDLNRLAIMAHDGLARAIRPSHAPFDGDTIFAVCPNDDAVDNGPNTLRLGSAAADCMARAVARAIWSAEPHVGGARAFRQASV